MTNAICLRSDGRRVSDETIDRPRRRFLALAAAGALMPLAGTSRAAAPAPIKAIAFDAFPIFDPRPVLAAVRQRFPAEGEALGKLWFAKLFPYTWLRTAAEQYAGFESVALEALDAAAGTLGMTLQSADREAAIAAFSQLALWPDAAGRLAEFRRRGLRLAFLSNLPEAMLRTNMRRTGIEPFFQAVLSTDRVRAFKPAPKAYRLAPAAFALKKEEIAFAAFAAWDAAGASWFGYPTVWVNRLGQPAEPFGAPPVPAGRDLAVLNEVLGPAG